MDRLPPPRAGHPRPEGRAQDPQNAPGRFGPAGSARGVLSPSHWIAIAVAVVVVSTVGIIAFVVTRSGDTPPPDGNYRLVARDSALCLTAAPATGAAATGATGSTAPSGGEGVGRTTARPPRSVLLSACPDADRPLGAAATAPAVVSALTPGSAVSGIGGIDGMTEGGSIGRWALGATDGAAMRALRPAGGEGLCLTMTGGAAASPLALEPCRGAGSQTWSLRQVGRSDYFQVVAAHGRRCLDTVTVDDATVAVEKMCSSEPSQQWRFDPVR